MHIIDAFCVKCQCRMEKVDDTFIFLQRNNQFVDSKSGILYECPQCHYQTFTYCGSWLGIESVESRLAQVKKINTQILITKHS